MIIVNTAPVVSASPRVYQTSASARNGPVVTWGGSPVANPLLNQVSHATPKANIASPPQRCRSPALAWPVSLTINGPTKNITQTAASNTISGTTRAAA